MQKKRISSLSDERNKRIYPKDKRSYFADRDVGVIHENLKKSTKLDRTEGHET